MSWQSPESIKLTGLGPLLLLILGGVSQVVNAASDSPRPNVILMVADDLGFQLGCYGDSLAKTPHLDQLAKEGTRYTRAYCTTASCSASRSVILTGLQNHATGHFGHAHGYNHFSTYDTVLSLPKLLSEAGYRTCRIGKYHLAPAEVYPFEFIRDQGIQGARNSVRMAENAKEWIAENDDRPFFLYWCSTDPHRGGGPDGFSNFPDDPQHYPEIPPTTFPPDELALPAWLPDHPEVRQEWAAYYRAIARLDVGVGTLMQGLKDLGKWDNTLIIFISDNGPPFPGAKTTTYEPGINLPLLVRDPRQSRQGLVSEALVSWADLTPTILDYCKVAVPQSPHVHPVEVGTGTQPLSRRAAKTAYTFHGRSAVPTFSGEDISGWDQLFASHTFHEITMYYPMRVAREGPYKLIVNLAHPLPYPFASDLQASPTWQGVLERQNLTEKYGQRTVQDYLHRPRFEFYNLDNDPHEISNLAEDGASQAKFEELKRKLRDWQKITQDPWELKWDYE